MQPVQALLLRLGEHLYALPIRYVVEVLPALPIEPIPGSSPHVLGGTVVRGELLPVLDLASLLGVKNHRPAEDPHIVRLRVEDRFVGLLVDEALNLIDLDASGEAVVGSAEEGGRVIHPLKPEAWIGEMEASP